ncbi:hypothetical protein CI105_02060 [Candidatus Izimaplasma bacterium ZiA1]|uniref:RecX family transcriptional regulator n=1 Tax=Candidatus Izimoplasma sp. ZiA1 TaxID=2024899 RepID=UPI000BAA820D|nr:hypothetical protein CI105_02060 [Candidatus Izimaplasma bacterium ZiA1]
MKTPQKINLQEIKQKSKERYQLTFEINNEFEKITVNSETVIKYNLLKPKEISEKDYNEILNTHSHFLLMSKAIHYIDYQERSEIEVYRYLNGLTTSKTVINQIINELKQNKYIDDRRAFDNVLRNAIEFEMIGPNKLKDNLYKRGFSKNMLDKIKISYNDSIELNKLRELFNKEIKYEIKKMYNVFINSLKTKFFQKGYSLHNIETVILEYENTIKELINIDSILDDAIRKEMRFVKSFDSIQKSKLINKLLRQGFPYNEVIKKLSKE